MCTFLVPTYLPLVFDGRVCVCAYASTSEEDEEREVNCNAAWFGVTFLCSSGSNDFRSHSHSVYPNPGEKTVLFNSHIAVGCSNTCSHD